jgi:ribosomal protein S12 methylthiotransferase accessory factor
MAFGAAAGLIDPSSRMSSAGDPEPRWVGDAQERAAICVARAAPAIGAGYGIIRAISDLTIEADDPRLFHAATQTASCTPLFNRSCFDRNGGCGLTRELARASAVGETLERYAAAAYDERTLIAASYAELTSEGLRALDPRSIPLYSERQYSTPGFPYRPLRPESRISWTWGTSLVSHHDVLVPACLVFIPFLGDSEIAHAVSTGLACDISPVGATLNGLYEVIERDAVMITWMGRLGAPRLAIDRLPGLDNLFDRVFRPSGLEFVISDISTDLAIPVVFALAIDRSNDGLALTVGAAANADYGRAALKALIEAAQGRLWLKDQQAEGRLAQILDRRQVATFEDHVRWFGHRRHLRYVDFLATSAEAVAPEAALLEAEDQDGLSQERQLERMVAMLANHDLDVIVVDITPADVKDLGFTVVKTLVPGLVELNSDHLLPRNGSRRLYEVPRRLGYGPRDEYDLNDVPHPFP